MVSVTGFSAESKVPTPEVDGLKEFKSMPELSSKKELVDDRRAFVWKKTDFHLRMS
jgi:hypothetical protein